MAFISNGTTILDAGSFSASLGALVHIKTLTASNSSSVEFLDGSSSVVLDSTYPIYKFEWINIRPSQDGRSICIQANNSGGSGFNETITSSLFRTYHKEDNSVANLQYNSDRHQSQGTGLQPISFPTGNGADECTSGEIYLFGISSTTFVKNFIAVSSGYEDHSAAMNTFTSGYFNTTNAIDEFKFSMNSGDIISGKIKLYGIKDS